MISFIYSYYCFSCLAVLVYFIFITFSYSFCFSQLKLICMHISSQTEPIFSSSKRAFVHKLIPVRSLHSCCLLLLLSCFRQDTLCLFSSHCVFQLYLLVVFTVLGFIIVSFWPDTSSFYSVTMFNEVLV